MMIHRLLTAALLLCTAACHAPSTPFPRAEIAGLAPIPYTAAALRENHRSGSTTEMEIVRDGAVVERMRTEFQDADATSVTLRMQPLDVAGAAIGDATVQRATWEELRGHAHFPAAATDLGHAKVTVPAGTFECWVYAVHAGDEADTVLVYHFAVKEPGPPVLLIEQRGGVEVGRMQLAVDGRH